jgi:hypothetical protein
MKLLAKFQASFFEALFNNAAENIVPYLANKNAAPKILAYYQKSVFLSLKKALAFIFPLTSEALGNLPFQKICLQFIKENPPQQENILFYGEKMCEFLKQVQAPIYAQGIAKLEWTQHFLYYQKDEKPLEKKIFKTIEPQRYSALKCSILSHAKFFKFHYDLKEIIESIRSKRPLSIKENPSYVLLIRPHYKVEVEWLDETLYEFLIHLSQNECLEIAYNNAVQKTRPFDLTQALVHCLEKNYFSKIS